MAANEDAKRRDYAVARANQELFRNAIQHCMDGNVVELSKVLTKCMEDSGPGFSMNDVVVGFKSEGRTLLHVAASGGKPDVLEYLLGHVDKIANVVNVADDKGMTLLINSTISESAECMRILIGHGANVNARNADGASALHFAAADGNLARIELLCTHGAELTFQSQSGTPLHWAAGKGHVAAIKYLLSLPQGEALRDLPNTSGVPPVLMAAVCGCDDSVQMLVDSGADVGAILAGNVTLLHICAEHGMARAVEAILRTDMGVRCSSIVTNEGNSPLYLAAMAGRRDVAELLLGPSGVAVDQLDEVMAEGTRRMDAYHAAQAAEKQRKEAEEKAKACGSVDPALAAELDARVDIAAEALQAAEAAKDRGNEHFRARRLAEAVAEYSEAIRLNKYCAAYYSNRSVCYLAMQENRRALIDAEICRRLEPQWVKGCYRLAAARLALDMFEDAAVAAFEGCKLEPQNKELKELMQEAVRRGQEDHKRKVKAGERKSGAK